MLACSQNHNYTRCLYSGTYFLKWSAFSFVSRNSLAFGLSLFLYSLCHQIYQRLLARNSEMEPLEAVCHGILIFQEQWWGWDVAFMPYVGFPTSICLTTVWNRKWTNWLLSCFSWMLLVYLKVDNGAVAAKGFELWIEVYNLVALSYFLKRKGGVKLGWRP